MQDLMAVTVGVESGGTAVEEKVKRVLFNSVDNPWEFVVEAAKEYKKEFRKTSKIGLPPHVDDILEKEAIMRFGDEEMKKKIEEKQKIREEEIKEHEEQQEAAPEPEEEPAR